MSNGHLGALHVLLPRATHGELPCGWHALLARETTRERIAEAQTLPRGLFEQIEERKKKAR